MLRVDRIWDFNATTHQRARNPRIYRDTWLLLERVGRAIGASSLAPRLPLLRRDATAPYLQILTAAASRALQKFENRLAEPPTTCAIQITWRGGNDDGQVDQESSDRVRRDRGCWRRRLLVADIGKRTAIAFLRDRHERSPSAGRLDAGRQGA